MSLSGTFKEATIMLNDRTRVSLAEVCEDGLFDANRNGSFRAVIYALNKIEKPVHYVSPYASNADGAFIALPEEGVEILVCQPEGSEEWYYMGSTFSPEPRETTGEPIPDALLAPMERVDPLLYNARGVPMKQIIKSQSGTGMVMSHEYAPEGIMGSDGFLDKKLELNTATKKITMSDSPAQDSIILDSGNGSRIMLTDDPQDDNFAARSLQVETVGPQKYLNKESQTDVVVGEGGRELQLLNIANGVEWGEGSDCGNVNIQSKWKDVNVFAQAKDGRIFIECVNETGDNQKIVIETNGESSDSIIIRTPGSVIIDAKKDININAEEGGINMKTSGKFSVDCDSFQVQANQVNIDPGGGTIELANGASPTSPSLPDQQSTYGNEGITTY